MASTPPSFLSHLVAVLSIYELAQPGSSLSLMLSSQPVPRWDGQRTWETDTILQSLSAIGVRLGFEPLESDEIPEDETERPTDLQNPTKLPLPPPGPLVIPGPQTEMSALEELRLFKASVSDVARVCNAVARGDLTQKITANVEGIVMNQLKDVINTMVDRLSQFSEAIIHVSFDFSSGCCHGFLGGPRVEPEGVWRELTGVVNKLAYTLTNQIRSVAEVAKAVALGDLSKNIELPVDASGEMVDMKMTVNYMVAILRTLVAELTSMTLKVGSQGKSGSQIHVPGIESGAWFELIQNVNRVCFRLTDQQLL